MQTKCRKKKKNRTLQGLGCRGGGDLQTSGAATPGNNMNALNFKKIFFSVQQFLKY
jgi:hypothetical protein